jgi:hypothetical protein
MAEVIVFLLLAYAAVGVLFAGWFATRGVNRRDPAAARAGVAFRLLIFPGAAGLWPFLIRPSRSRQ